LFIKNKENEINGLKKELEIIIQNHKEKENFSPENEPKLLIEKQEEITRLNKDLIELKNQLNEEINKFQVEEEKSISLLRDLTEKQKIIKENELTFQKLSQNLEVLSQEKLKREEIEIKYEILYKLKEDLEISLKDKLQLLKDGEEIRKGLHDQINKKVEKKVEEKKRLKKKLKKKNLLE